MVTKPHLITHSTMGKWYINFHWYVWQENVFILLEVTQWHMTHDTWHMTHDTWHMTHDTWHMTHDTWHMTHDTWHMTHIGQPAARFSENHEHWSCWQVQEPSWYFLDQHSWPAHSGRTWKSSWKQQSPLSAALVLHPDKMKLKLCLRLKGWQYNWKASVQLCI
jgi:hypothetical protein